MGRWGFGAIALLLLFTGVVSPLLAADDIDATLDGQSAAYPDPYERMNRRTLAFNGHVDDWVISPMARAYDSAVPNPVRAGFRNFFANLQAPAQLVNDLLHSNPLAVAAALLVLLAILTVPLTPERHRRSGPGRSGPDPGALAEGPGGRHGDPSLDYAGT